MNKNEQNSTYKMKATKTEMVFKNSCVPSRLRFQELAPWGHRKDARHIPAYPCSARWRWPVFSEAKGTESHRILPLSDPKQSKIKKNTGKMTINRSTIENRGRWFLDILKNGSTHWPQQVPDIASHIYLGPREAWYPSHTNIADKWGVILKKNMVYYGVIGFDQSLLWSFEWL